MPLLKTDAIARLQREHPTIELRSETTHFANINARKNVWWYDIPLNKVTSGHHAVLNLLAYDCRTDELHHLVVPTKHFSDSLNKLVVRRDRGTISLELSAGKSDFLQDVRSRGGGIQFARFRQS